MMNELVTSQILLWLFIVVAEVFRNYWIIENSKQRPNYLVSFLLRGMAAIVHGVLFNVQDTLDWLPVLVFQVTGFYVVFNPLLNKARNIVDYWYLGAESGWTDQWLKGKRTLYKTIYFACLIVCVLSMLLYIKY